MLQWANFISSDSKWEKTRADIEWKWNLRFFISTLQLKTRIRSAVSIALDAVLYTIACELELQKSITYIC